MDNTFWLKQTKPLFQDLDWNKPERRDQAGRLLIVGGNLHNFSAPAKAYELAKKAGIGTIKMVLPDKTKPLLKTILPEALYLPSTPSGEFASETITELLDYALWSDTVLIPGNLGRNSQTSILLEELLRSFSGRMVLACDSIEAVSNNYDLLLNRQSTTLIVSFAQLQKILKSTNPARLVTYDMDLVKLVDVLHDATLKSEASIMTLHQNQFIVAFRGQISTTKAPPSNKPISWRVAAASYSSCYQTWNPHKEFEALTHVASLL